MQSTLRMRIAARWKIRNTVAPKIECDKQIWYGMERDNKNQLQENWQLSMSHFDSERFLTTMVMKIFEIEHSFR